MNALLVITSLILLFAMINLHLWHRRKHTALNQSASHISANSAGIFLTELDAMRAGTIGLGERLVKMERKMNALIQRIDQLELDAGGQNSYAQAIKLVKQGINKKDLMNTCELSEVEAGLLMMMHKEKEESQFRH